MTCLRRLLQLFLFLVLAGAGPVAFAQPAAAPPRPSRPPLILISIDGFRPDYLARGFTPTLAALAADGVRAGEGMRPSFPSLTFPNHYTLVTGLYPDHHGITNNTMDDPRVVPDTHFTMSDYTAVSDRRWWDKAEPLWVTAKQQGLRTATMFWPGAEAPIHGIRPDFWAHFDAAIKPDQRVDVVLDWLDQPADKRPEFITLYFDQVDHEGHLHGPNSPEVNAALQVVDAALARLMEGLRARGLDTQANIVVVADHGMADTSRERLVYLDDLAPAPEMKVATQGPVSELSASPDAEARLLGRHGHMACWRKGELPARLHYGTNPRVQPIVCIADIGWEVVTHEAMAKRKSFSVGEHGYDNAEPLMRALFVAHGPAFRRGVIVPAFDNVDVYPLLAKVLGVRPEPSDGRLSDVAGLLN